MNSDTAGRVILLVEDNDDNRLIYGTLLRAYGFTVREAAGAESGIAIARSEQPAVVLMDIGLPAMDGIEATRILKRDPLTLDIPIVALTAHGLASERQRALSAGVNGYLVKPVTGAQLLQELQQVFAGTDTKVSPSTVSRQLEHDG